MQQRKGVVIAPVAYRANGRRSRRSGFGVAGFSLEAAYATFDGKELFPTKEEKAARLGVGLVSNHAFVDGNKRIGIYVLLAFLEINGIPLYVTDEELIEIGLGLAESKVKYEELLKWIQDHE